MHCRNFNEKLKRTLKDVFNDRAFRKNMALVAAGIAGGAILCALGAPSMIVGSLVAATTTIAGANLIDAADRRRERSFDRENT